MRATLAHWNMFMVNSGLPSIQRTPFCMEATWEDIFWRMMKKLNMPAARCHGSVITDSPKLLVKIQELRYLASKEKHVEVEKQVRNLRLGLDMSRIIS